MAFVIGVCTLKYYGLKDKIKKEDFPYLYAKRRKVIMIIFLNVIIGG